MDETSASPPGRRRPDDGYTLLETLITMSILTVVMTMLTAALISVQNAVTSGSYRNQSSDQVRLGEQQLTSQIRSANYLYSPASEYYSATATFAGPACSSGLTTSCVPTVPTTSSWHSTGGFSLRVYTQTKGLYRCVQWRVYQQTRNQQALEYRSWSPDWQTSGQVTSWLTVATDLVNPSSTYDSSAAPSTEPPFVLDPSSIYGNGATSGNDYARLIDINLIGNADPTVSSASSSNANLQASAAGRDVEFGYDSRGMRNQQQHHPDAMKAETRTVRMQTVPSRDERGMALITAILVTMIVVTLATLAFQVGLHSLNTSSLATQLVQSSDAAEAGIDATIGSIGSDATLPCCPVTSTDPCATTLSGTSTSASYSLFITYYNSSGGVISCTAGSGPASTPATAELKAIGYSHGVTATGQPIAGKSTTWSSEIQLTASQSPATGWTQAIYSEGVLTFSHSGTITTAVNSPANIYSQGTYTCSNAVTNQGSLVSSGDINISGSGCGATGTWWAAGSICDGGGGTVSGDLVAAGTASPSGGGTCNLSPSGKIKLGSIVAKDAYAKSTITTCPGSIQLTCDQNDSSVPQPPDPIEPFPQWSLNNTANSQIDTSQWTAAGYNIVSVPSGSGCNSTALADLASAAPTSGTPPTTPTLIYANCQISWNSAATYDLNCGVAIVAEGGFSDTNPLTIQADSGAKNQSCNSSNLNDSPNFYMLVPYYQFASSSFTPCSGNGNGAGNIDLTQTVTTNTQVGVMVYTPCSVTLTNSGTYLGQMYGGGGVSAGQTNGLVKETNSLTMEYEPVPIPGTGTSSGGGGSATYTVSIIYKHQG